MDKNKEKLCDLLNYLNEELETISVKWKRGNSIQDMWDNYQRIAVQIDNLLGSENSIDIAKYKKEISSFRSSQRRLVAYIKERIKDKVCKEKCFNDICQSIGDLIKKIQNEG